MSSGVQNVVLASGGSVAIDLDGDAQNDFTFSSNAAAPGSVTLTGTLASNEVVIDVGLFAVNHAPGAPIDGSGTYGNSAPVTDGLGGANWDAPFPDKGFAGVVFDISGSLHYGWIEYTASGQDSGTIVKWGYDATALTAISAAAGPATVVTRNAGSNPASLTADPVVLGAAWSATVDLTTTGHSFARVYGWSTAANYVFPGGQVWLGGGISYMRLPAMAGPSPTWNGLIPNDPSLLGAVVYCQAVHYGGVTPFALSNSQDLCVGL